MITHLKSGVVIDGKKYSWEYVEQAVGLTRAKEPTLSESSTVVYEYRCPTCETIVGWIDALAWETPGHCPVCGQRLEWSKLRSSLDPERGDEENRASGLIEEE